MNSAQQLHHALGIAVGEAKAKKSINENKNASATKSGPGRFAVSGKPGNRITKARPVRAYRALMAAWAQRRNTKEMNQGPKDEHGAYTLVGRDQMPGMGFDGRRMWLAGISAQRGY